MTAPIVPELAAIPEIAFSVEHAEPVAHAAAPTIRFRLALERRAGSAVRSATIGVRIDIAAGRRAYDATTEERLVELFGVPERWGTTLRTLDWTRTTALVGPFDRSTVVDLPVALSYDFDVAAAKYLHALRDGEIPLDLMFTGSVLYEVEGRIQAAPIPWDSETSYRLPVTVWREAMDTAFPDSAWLRLRREVFDRLYAFRAERAFTSWDVAVAALLDEREAEA